MNEGLTEKLEELSVQSESATASIPSIPSELIQHILSFLDPTSKDTLTTLLNCQQLVSRSFAASSLAPVVWRPLVQARWERGELKYPAYKLPLEEDQKLVDQLFPSPARDAPSDPFAVFRARWKLDGIAERHIDRLVNGTKDRLVSIDTTSVLGDLVFDHLSAPSEFRRQKPGRAPVSRGTGGVLKPCVVLLGSSRWKLGVQSLSSASSAERQSSSVSLPLTLSSRLAISACFLTSVARRLARILQHDGHRGSESDEPFEELKHLVQQVVSACASYGLALPWNQPADSQAELSQMFLHRALKRVKFLDGDGDALVALHPTAFAAVFIGIARRLPAPFAVKVELHACHFLEISWENESCKALVLSMGESDGAGHMFSADHVGAAVKGSWSTTPTDELSRYARELSNRACESHRRGERSIPRAYDASMNCCAIFEEDLQIMQWMFPSFLEQIGPHRTLDLPMLERCIIPTLSEPWMITAANEVLKSIKAADSQAPTPHHRPTDGSFKLKLRVGDTFLHRSTGQFGVIVGWEAREGAEVRATPRPSRGRRSKQNAMPLRRHVDYVYLAILESQDEYSEPARLVDDDLDINTRPHFDQVKALLGVQSLGRLFKDSLGQLGSGFVLVPSAEMLASWPDG